jgi:alkylation response protein AidB-like acyl-CoA dehydrogenase
MTVDTLLQRVHSIEPILQDNALLGEEDRQLPAGSVQAMREAGLYGMWVPRELGGLELDPMSTFRVLEEVSRIDAAAGWNLPMTAPKRSSHQR